MSFALLIGYILRKITMKLFTGILTFVVLVIGGLFFTSIIFEFFFTREWFRIFGVILSIIGPAYLFISGKIDKYPRFTSLMSFYLLGGIVFLAGIFNYIEYVYSVMIVMYGVVIALIVWKKRVKKLWWLICLVLLIQVAFFFNVVSSFFPRSRCSLDIPKYGPAYSCDCNGLKQHTIFSSICLGKRTSCYVFSDSRNELDRKLKKSKVECSVIDKYKQ